MPVLRDSALAIDADFQKFSDTMAREAGGHVVVSMRQEDGRPGKWYNHGVGERATHQYRTVMAHEIVYDIGDHDDWRRCIVETHALWMALNRLGVPYWGALSGGRGTHTHIFGPAKWPAPLDPAWRNAASGAILDKAMEFMFDIEADWRLLAPREGMRMCREFGRRKAIDGPPKQLWTTGPGPFVPLPDRPEDAYARANPLYPKKVEHCDWLPTLDTSWRHDIGMHKPCPVGPQCVPSGCDACPFNEVWD